MGAKLEVVLNCGPHETFLWLLFFGIDNRKLFCLCCLFVGGGFSFLSFYFLFCLFYFVRLGEERFYIIVHSVILEMVLQFLLKIIIYLLYYLVMIYITKETLAPG